MKTRVSTDWTLFLTIYHSRNLYSDILYVIQTHILVYYTSQCTKAIVIENIYAMAKSAVHSLNLEFGLVLCNLGSS